MKAKRYFDFYTAKRMQDEGAGFSEIARALGCTPSTVNYHLDPKGREKKRNRDRSAAALRATAYVPNKTHARVLERLAEIPRDTRTLTQIAFGDPLPPRSALAQRSGGM